MHFWKGLGPSKNFQDIIFEAKKVELKSAGYDTFSDSALRGNTELGVSNQVAVALVRISTTL